MNQSQSVFISQRRVKSGNKGYCTLHANYATGKTFILK